MPLLSESESEERMETHGIITEIFFPPPSVLRLCEECTVSSAVSAGMITALKTHHG